MPHKFAVGESVKFRPAVRPIDQARGPYIVTMLLPEIDGEFAYRIRNARVARTHREGKRTELGSSPVSMNVLMWRQRSVENCQTPPNKIDGEGEAQPDLQQLDDQFVLWHVGRPF
jgi:hypothetical protein